MVTHVVRCTNGRVGKLSPIGLPGGDIILGGHLQIDRINHDRVPGLGTSVDLLRLLVGG